MVQWWRASAALDDPCPGAGRRSTFSGMKNRLAGRAAVLAVCLLPVACAPVGTSTPGVSGAAGPAPTYTVFAAAGQSGLLHRIAFRPGTGAEVVHTVPVGRAPLEGEGPHGIAVDTASGRLYLTTGYGPLAGALRAYAPGPDTLVGREVRLGSYPSTVAVTPDGRLAFVTRSSLQGDLVPGGVSVVSTAGMREAARIPTCGIPRGGRIDGAGTRHYSVCAAEDRLVEIDTRTFFVTRTLRLRPTGAGRCGATWAEPSPDGQRVYVACEEADAIQEVDAVAWRVGRTFRTGRGPYRLEATPDGRLLVTTLAAARAIEVVDLFTGHPVARTSAMDGRPRGVVASPDSRYVFVRIEGLGGRPGRVDIYDTARLRRVASVNVGRGAGDIEFWRVQR